MINGLRSYDRIEDIGEDDMERGELFYLEGGLRKFLFIIKNEKANVLGSCPPDAPKWPEKDKQAFFEQLYEIVLRKKARQG